MLHNSTVIDLVKYGVRANAIKYNCNIIKLLIKHDMTRQVKSFTAHEISLSAYDCCDFEV